MKKKILYIIILIGLILLPNKAFAASLGLSCASSVTVGENIECTLTASHETISGVKGSISFSGMNFHSVSNLSGSNYFSVSGSGFDGALDIASGSKTLAKYVFTTTSAGTATINVGCSELVDGTNFDTHSCSGASRTITIKEKETPPPPQTPSTPQTPTNPSTPKPSTPSQPQVVLSNNNNLKSISVDNYKLDKIDNNNYTLTVLTDITSIKVNATAEDNKAKVSGTGVKDLQIGENIIEIIITSESGNQNKIYIKVIRKDGYYLEDIDSVLKNNSIKEDIDVSINSDANINKELLEKIKDNKKTIKFNYYDENKKLIYSWTVNGKEIKDTNQITTSILFNTDKEKDIYKVSNYADGMYINFKHSGELPKGTKIKLYVGDKFENKNIVNVYYYNSKEQKLEYIENNLEVKEGYIEFSIEHCSDYFVTMANIENAIPKEIKEDNKYLLSIIIEFIIIVILFAIIIISKLKSMKSKKINNISQ